MSDSSASNITIASVAARFNATWREAGLAPVLVESRARLRCYEVVLHQGDEISLVASFRIKVETSTSGYFEFSASLRWPTVEKLLDELRPPQIPSKRP